MAKATNQNFQIRGGAAEKFRRAATVLVREPPERACHIKFARGGAKGGALPCLEDIQGGRLAENDLSKKVSGASDDAPLFDEYLIFCPTVDSEKYSSWIELTGFSLLFSFGQIHDPEKFFFPFYDLLALFFPSIPCRFLFFRPRTNFRFSDLPSFHLIRSEYCSFALS